MKKISVSILANLFFFTKNILLRFNFTKKLLFIPGFENLRWKTGKLLALYNFYQAKKYTPAYADFTKNISSNVSEFNSVPVIDKENYIKKYKIEERCKYGKIPAKGVIIDESSGSTGMPTNWVRGKKERDENREMLVFGLNNLLGTHEKFIINAFALGPWATGVNVTLAFTNDAIVKSLGPDVKKIENTINFFGEGYTYIIMGYPPFLKSLVDSENVQWKKYNITFVFGGEGLSENMRDYFLEKGIKKVYGSLGASDLELNLAAENDFTIALRKLIATNKQLAGKILKRSGALPMIFQYNPMDFYIESTNENELLFSLCRKNYLSPKIRYNIHDTGHVIRMPELKQILKECNINFTDLPLPTADLPLLFHYGRSDMAVAYFGCKISPADIQEAIFKIPALAEVVNSFCLHTFEDATINKNLKICFELKASISPQQVNINDLTKEFFTELKNINQDFRESIKMVPAGNEPKIELYTFSDGPFKDSDIRIKTRYISKI